MSDDIDYLPEEMKRANPWPGLNTGFELGWRAAREATHARAMEASRMFAHPQPTPDWRAACAVVKRSAFGWDVELNNWIYSACERRWFPRVADARYGLYTHESDARAAMAQCVQPPSDWRAA